MAGKTALRRVMWIGADRFFYAGLLGQPTVRTMGALTIYVSLSAPLAVRVDGGGWERGDVAVIPPGRSHQIASTGRHVALVQIEPEFTDLGGLPAVFGSGRHAGQSPDIGAGIRAFYHWLSDSDMGFELSNRDIDRAVFGHPLRDRLLDPRIDHVVKTIRNNPHILPSARGAASEVNLSVSRLLHLFTVEVGLSFRRFRAWKQARSLLQNVQCRTTLTHLALDTGYPDSTHFSHSIRRVFGLCPRDILAGSRSLTIHKAVTLNAHNHERTP